MRSNNLPRRHRGSLILTDQMILNREDFMTILEAIGHGRVHRDGPGLGADLLLDGQPIAQSLSWAAKADLIHLGIGSDPILLPRGHRLLQIRRGELPMPPRD